MSWGLKNTAFRLRAGILEFYCYRNVINGLKLTSCLQSSAIENGLWLDSGMCARPQNALFPSWSGIVYKLCILGISKVRLWDSEEYSSPSSGNTLLYSEKPNGCRCKSGVELLLTTTAKCVLFTWDSVSDWLLIVRFRLRSIKIVQCYARTETSVV